MPDSTIATWRSDTKTALTPQSSVTLPANFSIEVQVNDILYEVVGPQAGGVVNVPTVVADLLIAGGYIATKGASTFTKTAKERFR